MSLLLAVSDHRLPPSLRRRRVHGPPSRQPGLSLARQEPARRQLPRRTDSADRRRVFQARHQGDRRRSPTSASPNCRCHVTTRSQSTDSTGTLSVNMPHTISTLLPLRTRANFGHDVNIKYLIILFYFIARTYVRTDHRSVVGGKLQKTRPTCYYNI